MSSELAVHLFYPRRATAGLEIKLGEGALKLEKEDQILTQIVLYERINPGPNMVGLIPSPSVDAMRAHSR